MSRNLFGQLFAVVQSTCACFVTVHEIGKRIDRLFVYYSQKYIYFEHDGMLYWTMGSPVEETTVINRCEVTSSYEYRREHGTLPETTPPADAGAAG
jgi:hypothetical protein